MYEQPMRSCGPVASILQREEQESEASLETGLKHHPVQTNQRNLLQPSAFRRHIFNFSPTITSSVFKAVSTVTSSQSNLSARAAQRQTHCTPP